MGLRQLNALFVLFVSVALLLVSRPIPGIVRGYARRIS